MKGTQGRLWRMSGLECKPTSEARIVGVKRGWEGETAAAERGADWVGQQPWNAWWGFFTPQGSQEWKPRYCTARAPPAETERGETNCG